MPKYKLEDYPDLKIIKKKFGEDFAKLCRSLFSTLLEQEGLLSKIIQESFAPSRFLYEDIIKQKKVDSFKNYVYSKVEIEKKRSEVRNVESPEVLMDRAGYKLYKCETQNEVNSFITYYKDGEELCTFWDSDRIKENIIFFAVKKNVDKIKREDFKDPKRQDEYGTSVISLQFTKGLTSTLSIKNRYNHTVANPDATFSNDLENIIPGLTESFEQHYGIIIGTDPNLNFNLTSYTRANDGKFYRYNSIYRYNYLFSEYYYCANNIYIDNGEATQFDKNRYIIFDEFILDTMEKKFLDKPRDSSFVDNFYEDIDGEEYVSLIKKIEILNSKDDEKLIKIWCEGDVKPAEIKLNKYNQICGYSNPNVVNINNYFLMSNTALEELNLPNVRKIGDGFLSRNKALKKLNLPNVREIGSGALRFNKVLESVSLPSLTCWGSMYNEKITNYINLIKNKIDEYNE